MKKTLGLFALMFLCFSLSAQTGTWTPANGDFSRPRTLLTQSEIPSVISYITSDSIYHDLYKRMYNEVINYNIGPATTDGKRRVQAHKAKNNAFILLLNRKPGTGTTLDTLTGTDRTNLTSRGIQMMDYMNPSVEAYPNWDPYLWRSNELVSQLLAYDLMLGAGIPDSSLAIARSKLVDYAEALYRETDFNLFGAGFWPLKVNNHGLRTAGALALAGIVLNDQGDNGNADRRASSWISAGLFNIEEIMWKGNEHMAEDAPSTSYAEGSHYLDFGFRHILPTFQALSNVLPDTTLGFTYDGSTNSFRHPFHDPRYEKLYHWAMITRMPDGRMPPLEDSFIDQGFPLVALAEKPQFLWEMDYEQLHSISHGSLKQQLNYSSDDARADFLAAHTLPIPANGDNFQFLPEAGSCVMRSDWGTNAVYMHLYAQHNEQRESAKGHNQVDATSFMIHAFGQELAMDPGYLKWDRRDEVEEAKNHNMVLVDGNGPAPSSTLSGGGVDAWLENPQDMLHFDYCEARTNYESTDVVRKMLGVRGRYFFEATQLNSGSGSHTYDWRLHAHGKAGNDTTLGIFQMDSGNKIGYWWKNGVNLMAKVEGVTGALTLTQEDNKHEYNYDSARVHTTLQLRSSGMNSEIFLTALLPFVTDTPLVKWFGNPDMKGMSVAQGGYFDLWLSALQANAPITPVAGQLPSTFATDAELCFFSVDSTDDFAAMYLQNATEAEYDGKQTFMATNYVDFILEKRDSSTYRGYMSDLGTVQLYFPHFSPGSVNGWGITNWTYNNNTLSITFNQSAYFWINRDVITGEETILPEAQLKVFPNPASSHLFIQLPAKHTSGQVTLSNIQGKTVRVALLHGNSNRIELVDLPGGIYLARISTGGQTFNRKILIAQ